MAIAGDEEQDVPLDVVLTHKQKQNAAKQRVKEMAKQKEREEKAMVKSAGKAGPS